MKTKNLKFITLNLLYLALVEVVFVGCNNVELKTKKQTTLDSLEMEYAKYDSLYEYYSNRQSEIDILSYDMDTFWYYRTKTYQCSDKQLYIHREIVRLRDGNERSKYTKN